ncbi:esterase [Reticulibacter mediterranei]|uniref:Esterase n=1 Tax=Reticulibacter mediterranei TaxID=2778369 RepID=A0A8J3ID18_9CHLR|nr:esterase [Reticulibacter mediterranei]
MLVKALLRLIRKPIYASEQTLRQHIARARKKEKGDPPPSVQRACQIEKDSWQGITCYTLRPFSEKGANGHVLYLHGGGYHGEMVPQRWQWLSTLINRSDVTATVPLYPLVPEHTYRDTYPWLFALYQHLCDTLHPENLTIMGDSAGAGMALSLVQQVVAQGLPHPKQTLLLSPWVDLALQNPAIRQRDRSDPTLTSAGLLVAARWWAGGDDPASPVLSPIHGSLAGIGPLLIAVGTDELFLPDTLLLRERARAEGVDLEFIEKEGLAHLFMFAPIPEAKPVVDRLVERLKH